jgi:hypothetical protein
MVSAMTGIDAPLGPGTPFPKFEPCHIVNKSHPEERALARVSKDGREFVPCIHPSRRRASHGSSG